MKGEWLWVKREVANPSRIGIVAGMNGDPYAYILLIGRDDDETLNLTDI